MELSKEQVNGILISGGVDTTLLAAVHYMGDGEYELAFETLEVDFSESAIVQSLEDAGFEPADMEYESPAQRGEDDGPASVIPYFYVTVLIDEDSF